LLRPGVGIGKNSGDAGDGAVKQSGRKLIGTLGVVALVIVYAIGGGAIYANFLGGQPWWVLLSFFAVVGLSWFFPAAWLIRWMAKPDA
jgi:uncharacterized membrane protein YeiH